MSPVWLNGRIVDDDAALVSVHDRGFTLADGLFETMRAYGGRVFRLDAHLNRLQAGATRIGLPCPEGLDEAVQQTLAANELSDAAVRLTVTRGVGGEGLLPPECSTPTVVVTVRRYAPLEAWYRLGARAIIARTRLNEYAATAGLKRLGCCDNVVALSEARAAGCEEALLVDTAGHLVEGTISNLFLVIKGILHTPPLSCGALAGITRSEVMTLGGRIGIEGRELALAPETLKQADEAFLTNSLRELVPLVTVDGMPIGDGRPGPVTLRLLDEYRSLVRSTQDRSPLPRNGGES